MYRESEFAVNEALLFDGAKSVNFNQLSRGIEPYTTISGADTTIGLYAVQAHLYRCVHLRAAAVASLPFRIVNTETGDTLTTSADDEWTKELDWLGNWYSLLYATEAALCLSNRGAFWYQLKNMRNDIIGLRWLLPSTISPYVDPRNGITHFDRASTNDGVPFKLKTDEVVFFRNISMTDELLSGSSPANAAMTAAGMLNKLDLFAEAFFERGAIKATILTYEGRIHENEKSKLRSWWNNVFSGLRNAFRTEIVNARVKPVVIGEGVESLNNEALTTQAREAVTFAMGVYGMLPSSGASDYATPRHEKNFYQHTVVPQSKLIAATINNQLFLPRGLKIIFEPEKLPIFQEEERERAASLGAFTQAVVTARDNGLNVDTVLSIFGYDVPEGMSLLTAFQTQLEPNLSDEADLKRWKTKSIKSLRRGRSGLVSFSSDTISHAKHTTISALLACRCAHDESVVTAIFDDPTMPSIPAHKAVSIPETSPLHGLYEKLERKFGREWLKVRAEQLAQLEELGSADAIEQYLSSEEGKAAWAALLMPSIIAYLDDAVEIGARAEIERLSSELALDVDWSLINEQAARWAEQHAAKLVNRRSKLFKQTIAETDIKNIRQQIKVWSETGEDFAGLVRRIGRIVTDKGRPELIASTEATRAYAQGVAQAWQESGLVNADDTKKLIVGKNAPPLHPRCRCWLTLEPDRGVIFNVARDERVCPICSPLADKVVVEI